MRMSSPAADPGAAAMTRRGAIQAAAAACAGFAACASPPRAPDDYDAWAAGFAADWVRLAPERATAVQILPAAEQRQVDRELTPRTIEQRRRGTALARAGLAVLDRVLAAGAPALDAGQRASALTMQWSLAQAVAAVPFEDHRFVFDQFGLHVQLLALLAENHPLRDALDVEAWLARLAQVAPRLDEGIALARRAAARGLLPPRFIVERVRTQLGTFLEADGDANAYLRGLLRRSAGVAGLDESARAAALARARALVARDVRPAYRRVLALLDELLPRTGTDAGFWRLPEGDAAYRRALVFHTTTDLDAERIHAIGREHEARLAAEMDTVLRRLGHGAGSVDVRIAELRRTLQPAADPDPRPALLRRYADHVRDNQRRSQALFRLQPRAPVEVRRVGEITERTAAAHYTPPAPDGSRPGIFWVPLPGPSFNVIGMRTLAVHEAVPGHHFQIALQQETPGLPAWRRQRVFGGGAAHSEGWALYAERLAIENGWYDGDDVALLGALDSQRFRARRLVVDTGLHARRWTREQAIAYGISPTEVERYVANPGQACAYMVGMLRLLELRDEARTALGSRFDLRDFHDLVLGTGSVPLAVLAEVVRGWAGAAAKRAAA